MPARKPQGLKARHDTKDEIEQRTAAESAMTPESSLPMSAPSKLDGHEIAAGTWRRLMRIYSELDAHIVTTLDRDLLLNYCLISEQLVELDELRAAAFKLWADLMQELKDLPKGNLEVKLALIGKLQIAMNDIKGMDARCDQKRRLLLVYEQSLYLTPRSRAGVAPAEKEKPIVDPMDELLDGNGK
jgi:hypothetical protein